MVSPDDDSVVAGQGLGIREWRQMIGSLSGEGGLVSGGPRGWGFLGLAPLPQ